MGSACLLGLFIIELCASRSSIQEVQTHQIYTLNLEEVVSTL